MPRRNDIEKILIIGSGPIVIGQAAEFDYSGVQACKVLMEEGFEVVLVNSNPATIMTDPEFATATYIEPIELEVVEQVIRQERPDALLPTLGGQTALNLAKQLAEERVLDEYGVELIGANYDAIRRAEDRQLFRDTMESANLKVPKSIGVSSMAQAERAVKRLGLPLIVRPAFTLGGEGGGMANTSEEFHQQVSEGLHKSPINQVLLEESLVGWAEFELELMRDVNDNVVVICSIENIDPMGIHTGDSVTVAPAQTLSDRQYQVLRDQAKDVIRAVGVETGGSNIQFAFNPETDEVLVIEMNPRVSRSSALASKATGFPIAKIAARLAVGYALEEIPNDITKLTPASFEPTIDYTVVKIPRFAFEKFPGADSELTTHMKSVGEVMAIGRTFKEAFAKAMRSRELDVEYQPAGSLDEAISNLPESGSADFFDSLIDAFRLGAAIDHDKIEGRADPWFLRELQSLARTSTAADHPRSFKAVDTCAAEFEAETPYFYSTAEVDLKRRDSDNEALSRSKGSESAVVILGSGPNRIGQGIEFDYCCVHAAMCVKDSGRDAVMINCNPETVSTDYDTSTRLYFEPLTVEDVLEVCRVENPEGLIVQFGGQTPLRIARQLEDAGVNLLGTSVEAIDLAEDRGQFGSLLRSLEIDHPPYGTANSGDEAMEIAPGIGYPLLVRPSYVLGGRGMEICYTQSELNDYVSRHVKADPEHPLLLDRFLENAVEIDVDAICDGTDVFIGGVMQHVEEAGIHSGDSACVIPTLSIGDKMMKRLCLNTRNIALKLGVVGLINIQFAIRDDVPYVLEANPRASRTIPFVSKAVGIPLAKVACRVMLGEKLSDIGLEGDSVEAGQGGRVTVAKAGPHVCVKEAVLPFGRFTGVDTVLGPEMKSTGEVMGIADTFPKAFGKAQAGAGQSLPQEGTAFITVCDGDKPAAAGVAQRLHGLGIKLVATSGTASSLERMGLPVEALNKIGEGSPHVVDRIEQGGVDLVINTPAGRGARTDGWEIRMAAVTHGVPCITTMSGANAAVSAIEAARTEGPTVTSLQGLHRHDDRRSSDREVSRKQEGAGAEDPN